MAVVVGLDPDRGLLEAEQVGDAGEQLRLSGALGKPPPLQRLAGIGDRMVEHAALLAALRHREFDAPARLERQGFCDQRALSGTSWLSSSSGGGGLSS